jgi:hypothetical protein
MAINYLAVLGDYFPGAEAYATGDPLVYNNLIWTTTPVAQADLDAAYFTMYKTNKIITFSENARADIVAGFASPALGYQHWYDAESEDQLNLIGAVATASDMYYSSRPYSKPYQIIDMGGLATGTRVTGLLNNTTVYNAEIKINGVSSYISVSGVDAQTYDTLISQVNADLALNSTATMSIENGNLVLYGDGHGSTFTVEIIDASFGASMPDFVAVLSPVPGTDGKDNLLKEYKLHTHANLLEVINDGKDVKLFILQKFAVKKAQIMAAANIAAIDAIVWE